MAIRGNGVRQQKVLKVLLDDKPRTCREIAQELADTPVGKVAQVIERLHDWGDDELVKPVGVGKHGARRWVLTMRGREAATNGRVEVKK